MVKSMQPGGCLSLRQKWRIPPLKITSPYLNDDKSLWVGPGRAGLHRRYPYPQSSVTTVHMQPDIGPQSPALPDV